MAKCNVKPQALTHFTVIVCETLLQDSVGCKVVQDCIGPVPLVYDAHKRLWKDIWLTQERHSDSHGVTHVDPLIGVTITCKQTEFPSTLAFSLLLHIFKHPPLAH